MSSQSILEMQEIVRSSAKVHVCGSGTKRGLHSSVDGAVILSIQSLQGIVSYDPQEFVVTMLAGTRVSDVVSILAEQGQYLPFDPLLGDSEATMGGTVASNAAGPGRFRFGGIRDFLLGVRFIDGRGNCIRGGGQVVKNAAGFDYPKLMVGSQGKLGLIYELTFKVFPRPERSATVLSRFRELEPGLTCMNQLASSAMDIEALDLVPLESSKEGVWEYDLAIRIGGIASAIPARLSRLQRLLPDPQVLEESADAQYWRDVSNFAWADATGTLLKLPTTPSSIPALEQELAIERVARRYSVGGNVAWIVNHGKGDRLKSFGAAQTFLGYSEANAVPTQRGPFGQALERALDPEKKFV